MENSLQEELDYIKKLQVTKEGRVEARERCYVYLTHNPAAYRIRIALARLFYLDGYYDFSRDALRVIKPKVSASLLDKLMLLLGESSDGIDKVISNIEVSSE